MNNSREYNISNEHVLLVNILNDMYNDNIRQINNLQQSITIHNNANNQIRNLLVQLLYSPTTNNRRNSRPDTRTRINNYNAIPERSVPYIDNIQRYYNTPRNNRNDEQNGFTRLLESFFLPINIYPTASQIETATRIVRYRDITSPINRACPISLENFNENDMVTVIRYCSHIFNSDELKRWFETNCRCPVCRYDIRNYNPNISSLQHEDGSLQSERGSLQHEHGSLPSERGSLHHEDGSLPSERGSLHHEDGSLQSERGSLQDASTSSVPALVLDIIIDSEENRENDTSGNNTLSTSSTILSLLNSINNSSYR